MYSAVYKCVCKQYSEQLYADLITHVRYVSSRISMVGVIILYCRTRLGQWSAHLGKVDDEAFINEFHKALDQYFHAIAGIVPIFTYMNRFYIEAKLHTDLKTELLKVFTKMVSDQHVSRLIPLMVKAQATPFCIPPPIMSTMCKHLYQLSPDYTTIEPKLFSSYLPNVLPQMTEEDLKVTALVDMTESKYDIPGPARC